MTRRELTLRQLAWRRSEEWRTISKNALAEFLRTKHLRPKCGAKAKVHGGPCQQLPMANGRCRFHGGLTPSGDRWHKPTLNRRKGAKALYNAEAKLQRRERERQERAASVVAMSPEELARHAEMQRTHAPGGKADRARRQSSRWLADIVAKVDREREAAAFNEGVFG